MDLSIVIPTLNRLETLRPCLDSIVRNTHVESEIIVYANLCTAETRTLLSRYPSVLILEDEENSYFTKAVNAGIHHSRGHYVFLLNDDCVLKNDRWFPFYRNLAELDETIAMVGPLHGGFDELPYGWVEPYATMYSRSALDLIGSLPFYDESFALWWSDIYHSYRAMNMGLRLMALEPSLVDMYIEHRRPTGEIGDTVAKFHQVLPREYFEFHGKALMYERLGIRDETRLPGYYGGQIWGVDDIGDLIGAPS